MVGAVGRMAGETPGPVYGDHVASFAIEGTFLAGLVALAVGVPLWTASTPSGPRFVDENGVGRPVYVYGSPGMRKAGIAAFATGLGACGFAVLLSYMPGNCNDSQPPDCTYPARDVAMGVGVVGLVATGAGIGLWVTGGRKVRAENAPAVSLVATPGGVGARGSF